jgi:hypothetical protein
MRHSKRSRSDAARYAENGAAADPASRVTQLRTEEPVKVTDPAGDDFAYQVAAYAWVHGLTANAIVRKLGLPSEPLYLMQVKRALRRAQDRFLKLVPLPHNKLRDDLAERAKRHNARCKTRFYVVDDIRGPTSGPVYVKAAELVSEIIIESVRSKLGTDGHPGVICNAGGQTVSEMVKVLLRNPPVLDESNEGKEQLKQGLLFVAANDAYDPGQFQRSANFLSVTMAELFGAEHLVYSMLEGDDFQNRYVSHVEAAALVICGAGTRENGLMAQLFRRAGLEFPEEAVGDLAFNLLDRNGAPVDLLCEKARRFMKQLNSTLDLSRLLNIAARNRVVLVLDSPKPELKKDLAIAALRREYATDVVLGARLARAILQDF